MKILVINAGSSSCKYQLFNMDDQSVLCSGVVERIGQPMGKLSHKIAPGSDKEEKIVVERPFPTHVEGMEDVISLLLDSEKGVIQDKSEISAIGHRVLHGGEAITDPVLIDDKVKEIIRDCFPLGPLHNPANLQGIEAAMTLFPKLPHVAVFDTAFHQSLPEHAYRYALPEALYREHGVRRYGFHGTSHRYVSHRAAEMAGLAVGDSSWLSAHLGNGSSTCAIVNGQSLDTSMGLTPLEGLVMGTRSGDVDPNLHSHLARTLGWSLERIDSMLNNESGLLGLSDLSNDMRTLEQEREQGHPGAALAIEVFCYRLAKSLAAMSCALPQLDGVIFTGGIGENSPLVRAKTAAHLRLFDLRLDQEANARCVRGVAGPIQAAGHPRVLVIPTNEERQIALDTLALLD